MEIIEEKPIQAWMIGLDDGYRYLRMNSFPGAKTYSWFIADPDRENMGFKFKWLGMESSILEAEYQKLKGAS